MRNYGDISCTVMSGVVSGILTSESSSTTDKRGLFVIARVVELDSMSSSGDFIPYLFLDILVYVYTEPNGE